MQPKFHVVMIDDQVSFLEAVKDGLQDEFIFSTFTRPKDALEFLTDNSADAVLLDYHLLPGDSAQDTLFELRNRDYQKPVMLLTGEVSPEVKLTSLDHGIDDFLTKPISMPELSAYLRNRIRRSRKNSSSIMSVKNLELNLNVPEVCINGEPVYLTNKEFQILKLLVTNPNSVVSKDRMLKSAWGEVRVEKNNIDTHMSNLRKKLIGFNAEFKTIKKIGFILRV